MDNLMDLYTPEGEAFNGTEWSVYPRPQMKRDSFFCLNGEWDFGIGKETEYKSKILVPFAPQSLLSGVTKGHRDDERLFYKKTFTLPGGFVKKRVLLHIGACDQVADVYLNGALIGHHEGGYMPFSFDVTEALKSENVLEIHARDALSDRSFPYGKQTDRRGGMWYTPVSGIWKTVWMESVPEKYIEDIRIETTINRAVIRVAGGAGSGVVSVNTPSGTVQKALDGGKAVFEFENPVNWSPENPYLYTFTVKSGEDEVESYFALRELSVREINGIKRMCLNGKPYFFHGVLDQGYYPDGLFTPASPACFEKDILFVKELGFNTIRKHIKIEPEIFYYLCDRLGMCVFQDMVNNGDYCFLRDTALATIGFKKKNDKRAHRDQKTRNRFVSAMEETVRCLKNHPSVVYWTIFNEGWGQFDSENMYKKLKALDGTRFVATVSGWFKGAQTDVCAEHVYFKHVKVKAGDKPVVVSEFGGYACQEKGHVFNPDKEFGYKKFRSRKELSDGLCALYQSEIVPVVKKGLCGSIYTQLSDVEDEINGLVTYDRKVIKIAKEDFQRVSDALFKEMEKV